MGMDQEDPLLFFWDGPLIGCMGEWTSDKLTLKISCNDGKWVLKSGKRDLVLKDTEKEFEWSVYETPAMEKELYIASVSGYGPRTRLTMRPGRQHAGSGKKLVLWRIEHKIEDGDLDTKGEEDGEKQHEPEPSATIKPRDDSPGLMGDLCDEPRDVGSGGKVSGQRRDDKADRSRSRPGRSPLRKKAGKGGAKRGGNARSCSYSYSRSRSRSRSNSRGGRGRSPRRRGGVGGRNRGAGGKQADAKGDEEVTTIFITGLPDDAREDEVRDDLGKMGEIIKVVLMKRGSDRNAFVRFKNAREAVHCMEDILDGKLTVCGDSKRVKAEMARRNTN